MDTRKKDIILNKATQDIPGFYEAFHDVAKTSSEIVIFGSYAVGCESMDSDIDVLFVGEGKRIKTRKLDFIWINPKKLQQRSWLGSELANHIANYGVWAKGSGQWRGNVFVSEASVLKKKESIYVRLIHLYLKRNSLSHNSLKRLFIKVLLDFYRLTLLMGKKAIPPTKVVGDLIKKQDENLISIMQKEMFLGTIGAELLKKIFGTEFDKLFFDLKKML